MNDFKNKRQELRQSGELYCPRCLSTNVMVDKKGFSVGKAIIGAIIWLPLVIFGMVGRNKLRCTCLACGNKFKVGKK